MQMRLQFHTKLHLTLPSVFFYSKKPILYLWYLTIRTVPAQAKGKLKLVKKFQNIIQSNCSSSLQIQVLGK